MNKEICKTILMQQIKDKNSVFQFLMLNRRNTEMKYHTIREFCCSEFEFFVCVEVIDERGSLQVLFEDFEGALNPDTSGLIDFSNANAVQKEILAIERMELDGDELVFGLEVRTLEVKDYILSSSLRHPKRWQSEVRLNLKSGRIANAHSIREFLVATQQIRQLNDVNYCGYVFGVSDQRFISTLPWGPEITPNEKDYLQQLLRTARAKGADSQLIDVLLRLEKLGRKGLKI